MNMQLLTWVEHHLDGYKQAGAEFVVVFKHKKDSSLMFVEAYRSWRDFNAARSYWLKSDYGTYRVYDLDYNDYIREQNEVNVAAD